MELWKVLLLLVTLGKSFQNGGVAGLSCDDDEFTCQDESKCLSANLYCDGMVDCDDESDEILRNFQNPNQTGIPCRRSSRIICMLPESQVSKKGALCDADPDCRDDEFACQDGSRCSPPAWFCNGIRGCFDRSDEIPPGSNVSGVLCRAASGNVCILHEKEASKKDIICSEVITSATDPATMNMNSTTPVSTAPPTTPSPTVAATTVLTETAATSAPANQTTSFAMNNQTLTTQAPTSTTADNQTLTTQAPTSTAADDSCMQSCPLSSAAGCSSELTAAWMCELSNWRCSTYEWKLSVERWWNTSGCSSVGGDIEARWSQIFTCPKHVTIDCTNVDSKRYDSDAFGCTITRCSDGNYKNRTQLMRLWMSYQAIF